MLLVLVVTAATAAGHLVLRGSMPWQLLRESAVVLATTAAVLLVRRGSDLVCVAVALVVAVVCLAPGVALGAGRVSQGSWDLTAGAGCLLLVTGLGMFAVGLAGLRLVHPRALRATSRAAALAVTALLVFPAWPAFYAVDPPPARPDDRTSADLGVPAQDLRLRKPAGVTPAAWYLPTRSGAAVGTPARGRVHPLGGAPSGSRALAARVRRARA